MQSVPQQVVAPAPQSGAFGRVLVGMIALMLLLASPHLAAATSGDFIYDEGPDAITITGYTGAGGTVTLPETINSKPVKAIGDCAFLFSYSISAISLPSHLTTIGEHAFAYCYNLSSIVLPDTVTTVGQYAFSYCSSLTTAVLSKNLENLPYGMFCACYALTNVDLPVGLNSIGDYAFDSCSHLSTIAFPKGLKTIGASSFAYCDALTSITLPDSLTTIGDFAFANSPISEVSFLGDAPASLGSAAFGITSAACTVFYRAGASGFTSPTWHDYPCLPLSFSGDFSYVESESSITIVAYRGAASVLTIPTTINGKSVTIIGAHAFQNSNTLTSLTLPESIQWVQVGAFKGCTGLTTVAFLGSTPSTLPDFVFSDCINLTMVVLPDGLSAIGNYAFRNCLKLGTIDFPETLASIGYDAFTGCVSLTRITLPPHLTTLVSGAFSSCSALASATFLGHAPTAIGAGVFSDTAINFTIFYLPGANGFTSPPWQQCAFQQLTPEPLQIGLQGSDIILTFPSTLGLPYQLERTTNLASGTWTTLGGVQTGTASTLTYRDTGAVSANPATYYRLRLISP
jgi:hypothetical protein